MFFSASTPMESYHTIIYKVILSFTCSKRKTHSHVGKTTWLSSDAVYDNHVLLLSKTELPSGGVCPNVIIPLFQ